MKIMSMKDGTWIEFEGDESPSESYEIMCVCGHPLKSHSFWMSWTTNVLFTSQCVVCGIKDNEFVCEHFRPTDNLL